MVKGRGGRGIGRRHGENDFAGGSGRRQSLKCLRRGRSKGPVDHNARRDNAVLAVQARRTDSFGAAIRCALGAVNGTAALATADKVAGLGAAHVIIRHAG